MQNKTINIISIFLGVIILSLSNCTNSSSTESDPINNNVDKETFSGTSNSNGEYTFHSDVYNQDITVKVKSNTGTSLSNKNVDVASTVNNLIVIVSDPSKNYYPNVVITPSNYAKSLSKPEFGVIAVVLFAYTVAKTAKWLAEDPPYWEAGFRDGKLNEVCVTGDLEDLINTFSLLTGGIGGIIQVGSTVVSSLNLASTFGQVIDFGVNEMTGALLDANFDMDRDYTYCYYLPGADKSPLACLYIKDVGPPVQTTYSLNIYISGNGTVVESPYSQYYNAGESVQLTATPSAGWSFSNWQGDLQGSTNPTSITMNSNKSITAVFTENSTSNTGTVTDIDGNIYQTVKIGNQWWMMENLKVTHYNNGDAIPNVTGISEWDGLSSGAQCYNNNVGNYVSLYGRLYNWFAVADQRGLAPIGWHVPRDEEWKTLEMYLGMSQAEADNWGFRGTNEGSKLKSTSGWYSGGNGTNESGFSALPGESRGSNGYFLLFYAESAWFWSSTEDITYNNNRNDAWMRQLTYNNEDINRYSYLKGYGFSIRCVKD